MFKENTGVVRNVRETVNLEVTTVVRYLLRIIYPDDFRLITR